jgi:hypothetical protein
VAANTSTAARTGTVTIGGQTFTVNQAGAACNYTIAPTSQTSPAGGGTGSVGVTAQAGCAWTATSNAPWISVTSGASGSGNGTVGYSVAANTSTAARTGTVTIGGQTFTVNQAGLSCSFSLTPANQSMPASGGVALVDVTGPAGCSWTAVSNAPWLSITAGGSGSGNGTVTFDVAVNTTTAARTGTVTIGGQTFTVNQAGAACNYTIAPTSQSSPAGGGTGSVGVTAQTGCAWTATSNAPWISVTSGASGSGNGTVGYSVAANTSTAARTGTVTIGGQTFTVNQAGAACAYTIAPTSQTSPAGGGTGSVGVTAQTGCTWSAQSNAPWISVTSGASGSGNGTVGYSVAANTSTAARTGTVTIGDQTFTVDQAGAACSYSLTPTNQSMPASGGVALVDLTAPAACSWTATSNVSWLTITAGGSGSGNGTVTFDVAVNTGPGRTGTLTIGGQTFTVMQASSSCTYTLIPSSRTVADSGASGVISVGTTTGCAWTAESTVPWITASGSSPASGTVSYTVEPNTSPSSRVGTVVIGSVIFTVTQEGTTPSCVYSISPTSQIMTASGGGVNVAVSVSDGCAWSAATNATWLTIMSGAGGNGNGTVGISVAVNTGASRTGTVTIAGQTFTVTQGASTCSYTLIPSSRSVTASGASGMISVGTSTGCGWTAESTVPWITATGSGVASGSVNYTVAPNTTGSSRTGTILIGNRTFTVTQSQ